MKRTLVVLTGILLSSLSYAQAPPPSAPPAATPPAAVSATPSAVPLTDADLKNASVPSADARAKGDPDGSLTGAARVRPEFADPRAHAIVYSTLWGDIQQAYAAAGADHFEQIIPGAGKGAVHSVLQRFIIGAPNKDIACDSPTATVVSPPTADLPA